MQRLFVRHAALIALILSPAFAGCPQATCPTGEVAVKGRCYPEEAVNAVGGGVPVLCASPCSGDTPFCDYYTGTCVACTTDASCTSTDAAHCDLATHVCTPCAVDASCGRFEGRTHCEVSLGRCVECDVTNEESACGSNSCDASNGRCTDTVRHSRTPCQTCRADSECGQHQRCVDFGWYDNVPERVCLYDSSEVICATNASSPIAPYVVQKSMTTVHGDAVSVCAPPSMCSAVLSYTSHRTCSYSSDCGASGAALCKAGTCTMSCFDVTVGYAGCAVSDNCDDGLFCSPNP